MIEKFEKVVEHEPYEWQKGNLNLSHLAFFIIGFGSCLWFIGIFENSNIKLIIGGAIMLISSLFAIIKKRKVYWKKVK